jgi:acyl carrier protein
MNSDRKADILAMLTRIFRETFEDDSIQLTYATTAADIERWDSLSNIELLVAIESATGARFSSAEIADLANVGELVEVIGRR